MVKKYITSSKEETWELASNILAELQTNVIMLEGELGAGKTTFSQGVLQAAGAEGPFTSPTFVIMKHYQLPANHGPFTEIYHFDCYRIGSKDVLEMGWEELVSDPKNLVLVEWPDKIRDVMPEQYLRIRMSIIDEEKRELLVG